MLRHRVASYEMNRFQIVQPRLSGFLKLRCEKDLDSRAKILQVYSPVIEMYET
jgi:hypothetical protein